MGELVTADEARELRDVTAPECCHECQALVALALTVEVQAWRIAELEALVGMLRGAVAVAVEELENGCHYDAESILSSALQRAAEPEPCPICSGTGWVCEKHQGPWNTADEPTKPTNENVADRPAPPDPPENT